VQVAAGSGGIARAWERGLGEVTRTRVATSYIGVVSETMMRKSIYVRDAVLTRLLLQLRGQKKQSAITEFPEGFFFWLCPHLFLKRVFTVFPIAFGCIIPLLVASLSLQSCKPLSSRCSRHRFTQIASRSDSMQIFMPGHTVTRRPSMP